MKRFLILLSLLFCNVVFADTINLHWLNEDGSTYQNSTCVIDSDLILPATPPTKYGYTFTGWKLSPIIPIEYLENTGIQYIDTGYITNLNTKIDIDFQLFNITSYICGTYSPTAQYYLYIGSGSVWQWAWSSAYKNSAVVANTERHRVTLYSDGTQSFLILDGNPIDSALTTQQNSGEHFILFGGFETGRLFTTHQRIYSFKIYEHDVLVRDFIPVLDAIGTPCMYDKVEQKLYYNSGTGQFIAGPVVSE